MKSDSIPDSTSPFDAARLRAALDGFGVAVEIELHTTIGSTNDRAGQYLRAADPDAPPLLVAADHQIAGRGRQGRSWHSPPGVNALFSLALPPSVCREARVGAMNLAAAVAVCQFVERRAGLRPGIKWPNDVQLGEAKLAGILCEAAGPEGRRGMVVGIGLNVNLEASQAPPDLEGAVTSLRIATGRAWSREETMAEVAGRLLSALTSPGAAAWREVIEAWQTRCTTLGRWIHAQRGQERLEGTAAALEEDGALLLRDAEGRLHRLAAGEVTLMK